MTHIAAEKGRERGRESGGEGGKMGFRVRSGVLKVSRSPFPDGRMGNPREERRRGGWEKTGKEGSSFVG